VQGLAKGVGLASHHVDHVIGIAKAPYMTRFGEGPFPTELGGTRSAEWCGTKGITPDVERQKFPAATLLSADDFEFGVAIRSAGGEYGATTGRPRRTGWFDLPLLRYSCEIMGAQEMSLALTKLDVLNFCPVIKICTAYRYEGPVYHLRGYELHEGAVLQTAIPVAEVLKYCSPIYQEFPGWMSNVSEIGNRLALPDKLLDIIDFIENESGEGVSLLSVGPRREQTIFGSESE
jgi:adenylosuccinate synthase